MIIDNHVHVGWFTDGYHTPQEVWNSAMAAGIDGMAVSSTSTCAELYKNVVRELRELKRLGGERVRPILWLTPRMFKISYALPYLLHSRIAWKGIKMHWEAHPEWSHNLRLVDKALDVARQLNVPVLLHTGNFECCHAGIYKELIKSNPDLTFVLAHARPINEALEVLSECPNAYVDLAFVPFEAMKLIKENKYANRTLFGTDMPINKVFFKDISTADFIKSHVEEVKRAFGNEAELILRSTTY